MHTQYVSTFKSNFDLNNTLFILKVPQTDACDTIQLPDITDHRSSPKVLIREALIYSLTFCVHYLPLSQAFPHHTLMVPVVSLTSFSPPI